MNTPPKKRFYWLEGVTRAEVERSLDDRRPSRFRRQGPRRLLVAANLAALGLLAVADYLPGIKLSTYLAIAALLASLLLYLRLRGAVRLVADAPDELLDERQITIRNAAHVLAYRFLAIASLFYIGFCSAWSRRGLRKPLAASTPARTCSCPTRCCLQACPPWSSPGDCPASPSRDGRPPGGCSPGHRIARSSQGAAQARRSCVECGTLFPRTCRSTDFLIKEPF